MVMKYRLLNLEQCSVKAMKMCDVELSYYME